jgi:nitroreductase
MKHIDILPLIKERWSPRVFKDIIIEDQKVEQLIEAARWAPSSRNSQPWRFVIAKKSNTETWHKLVDCLTDFNKEWAISASHIMLACVVKVDPSTGNHRNHCWYDLGLAIGNLTFQANSMGIFVRNMGGLDPEKAVSYFNIPESIEPVVMLAIGYPDEGIQMHPKFEVPIKTDRKREPIEKLIFNSSWDKIIW